MSSVLIDDYNCPTCRKITNADLNMRTQIYTCLICGESVCACCGKKEIKE